ncbi:MAG TPA: class I SAM-dependent methyltransferase [Steroidobacteraceae bacterium]|nr:class I SAM-dependent methyltransferase [Steroidobacteraceae bacterium]
MGLYHHCVFPFLLDRAMASKVLRRPRTRTLARARGRILEVGFGTGMNLAHYPPEVTRIEALDPDVDLDRYSRPRIAAARIDVDFHHFDASRLPFDDANFDTVVCTLTLCSIPDVARALAEIRRVLKAGGEFLFLEHGLAPEPSVARWQRRLTPLQRRLGGGCHLDRDTVRLVTRSGLRLAVRDQYYLRGVPRFAGYMTEGYAVKR